MDTESQWIADNMFMVDRTIRRHYPNLYGDMLEEARVVGMSAMWESSKVYSEGKGSSVTTWIQDHIKWAIHRWIPSYIYGVSQPVYTRLKDLMSVPEYVHYDQVGVDSDDNWYLDTLTHNPEGPLDILLKMERGDTLNAGLATLSSLERRVIIEHVFEGRSYRDISEEVGTDEGNIQTSAYRARTKLKAFIREAYR